MPWKREHRAQTCRLCNRDTLYVTRFGLSNHAVVHHGCWYSAVRDEFVAIPEEELEEKRKAVQRGQTHRRRRPDPMLTQRGKGQLVRVAGKSVLLPANTCRRLRETDTLSSPKCHQAARTRVCDCRNVRLDVL